MPIEITLDSIPGGYSTNAANKGEKVQVSFLGFVSSEDGDMLVTHLDGVSDLILSRLPTRVEPSLVSNLLAIVKPDKTATVYINELQFEGSIRIRRAVKAGEPIFDRDIPDVRRMKFPGVTIPADAGFMLILSNGWRKGFYYDFVPLSPNGTPREYDVEMLLGSIWSYLAFQDLLRISETAWEELFKQRWFPFIFLGHPLLKKMIAHAEHGWNLDELLPEIREELDEILENGTGIWKRSSYFGDHLPVIERAIERYRSGDFVSTVAILYPRIEGVMRSFVTHEGSTQNRSAASLSREVVKNNEDRRHGQSLFLPEKFSDYLKLVFFANFSPGSTPDVGRHSVAHGEARASDFSEKTAAIGFLVLYQVALFVTDSESDSTESTGGGENEGS